METGLTVAPPINVPANYGAGSAKKMDYKKLVVGGFMLVGAGVLGFALWRYLGGGSTATAIPNNSGGGQTGGSTTSGTQSLGGGKVNVLPDPNVHSKIGVSPPVPPLSQRLKDKIGVSPQPPHVGDDLDKQNFNAMVQSTPGLNVIYEGVVNGQIKPLYKKGNHIWGTVNVPKAEVYTGRLNYMQQAAANNLKWRPILIKPSSPQVTTDSRNPLYLEFSEYKVLITALETEHPQR